MYGWHRYDASQRPLGSRSTRPSGGLPGSGALEVDEQHVFVSENKVETSLPQRLAILHDGQVFDGCQAQQAGLQHAQALAGIA